MAVLNNSSQSSLAIENESLKSELVRLRAENQECTKLEQSLKQMEGKLQDQDVQTQGLKKAEKKLKESKEKLRSLAKQLSGSVELVKNYQQQCARLDEELAQSKKEVESLREQNSSLKARVEVAEVEGTHAGVMHFNCCYLTIQWPKLMTTQLIYTTKLISHFCSWALYVYQGRFTQLGLTTFLQVGITAMHFKR